VEANADRVVAALARIPEERQPWLEPDILDHLRALAEDGVHDVVVAPAGFLSDHMEVLYDPMLKDLIDARQLVPETPLCAADCCPAPRRG
jgi:ferrochelatase